MKLRAFYGDPHGCDVELEALYRIVDAAFPGVEHWHLGDLVDRGPDSGRCVRFARKYFKGGVLGNHENAIQKLWDRWKKKGLLPSNEDKANTIKQLTQEDIDYIRSLPYLHVFDDMKLIICHGGLYPRLPLYQQSSMHSTTNNQMIPVNPAKWNFSKNRWWGSGADQQPKINRTEDESREDGFARWYELYDHEYDCIYGHSVMGLHPHVYQNKGYGKTIGVDTGSCFGGYITAWITPINKYIRIPCPEYVPGKNVRNFKLKER
jgi:diadenosine tetraphosphatase ApaH/serine/threonine PP2A family protein phosphatase